MNRSIYLLAAGLLGVLFYVTQRDSVFRGSSLTIEMPRREAITESREFLKGRGYDLKGYSESATFFNYETPTIYLEKNAGTEKTNEWLKEGRLPVWGWEVRFFKPLDDEEYTVWWNPKGKLDGYEHQISREKSLPTLSKLEAKAEAEKFLKGRYPEEIPLLKLIEQSEDEKQRRIDHYFKWKMERMPLDLRGFVSVTVSGNELTSVRKEVEVPESFDRAEETTFSKRSFLSAIVGKIDYILSILVILFLVQFWRRQAVRWESAIAVVGVLFVIQLLNHLNELPLKWHNYVTTETVPAFWVSSFGYPLFFLLISSTWAVLQFASADAMGRHLSGTSYSLGDLTHQSFLKSQQFMQATFAGVCAAGVQLGFVVVYYLIGNRFLGFYSPMEVRYDDVLSTAIPWISPLLVGLKPALTEEAIYRLFAIPMILHYSKKKWIALLVSSALWGFLHTSYYVEPIYARGLELTLVGLFFGFLYMRYGIWATIVCHYVYNSTLSSSLLLSSGDLYLQISSLAVVFILVAPVLWVYFKHRKLKDLPSFPGTALAWPAKTHATPNEIDRRARVDQTRLRIIYPIGLTVASLLFLIPFFSQFKTPDMQSTREEAIKAAKAVLEKVGFRVGGYYTTARLGRHSQDELVLKYLQTRLDGDELKAYVQKYSERNTFWALRFISPSKEEKCEVYLNGRNELESFNCNQPGDEPGEKLKQEESLKLAKAFLSKKGLDDGTLKYVGSFETDQPNRKDFTHKWKDSNGSVDGLERFVAVVVEGNRITDYDTYPQLPDSFVNEQGKSTIFKQLKSQLPLYLLAAAFFFVLIRTLFDPVVISPILSFIPIAFAIISAIFALGDFANQLPNFWGYFSSTVPTEIFVGKQLLALGGHIFGSAVFAFVLIVLFLRIPPQIYKEAPTFEDLLPLLKRPPWLWRHARVSLTWAMGLILFEIALKSVFFVISNQTTDDPLPIALDPYSSLAPSYEFFSNFWDNTLYWCVFAAGFCALRKYYKPWIVYSILTLFAASFLFDRDPFSWADGGFLLINTAVSAFVVFRVIRFCLPFYVWYAVFKSALPYFPWVLHPQIFFRFHAQTVLAVVVLVIVFTFFPIRRSKKPELPFQPMVDLPKI